MVPEWCAGFLNSARSREPGAAAGVDFVTRDTLSYRQSCIVHYPFGEDPKLSTTGSRTAKRATLTESVYELLRDDICAGTLPPGQKLVISTLAAEMDVSITPVREALRRLQREGLVAEVPYSGVYVSRLSVVELRELFAIRGVLEGYAISLITGTFSDHDLSDIDEQLERLEEATRRGDASAFRQANLAFHALLLRGDIGPSLREMIDQVFRNTERYRTAGIELDQAYLDHAQAEHRRLVAAVKKGDAAEAERIARQHALTFVNHIAESLERS